MARPKNTDGTETPELEAVETPEPEREYTQIELMAAQRPAE